MKVDLYKTHLNEGAHSRVRVGASASGCLSVFRHINDLSELQEDDEVFVYGGRMGYIKTSPIQEIIPYEDGFTIRTKTSTYKVEEVKEEEDGNS